MPLRLIEHLKPKHWDSHRWQGILAALMSAVVLGLAPTFGKAAMLAGADPIVVVTFRTVLAAGLLWALYALFWRHYIYVYPAGLIGCLIAGVVNGIGSLMYYTGLHRLDASIAQLLYMLYPILLTLFLRIEGHEITPLTAFRLIIALAAVFLLTQTGHAAPDWYGALLMVASGALYALHLTVNQRVLYDMPAPTVTLYTLTAMAGTVSLGYLLAGNPPLPTSPIAWYAILALTVSTSISRLTLFLGVKRLGGVQAALLGLSELLITVLSAALFLNESLSLAQWVGAGLLALSILLVVRDKTIGHLPPPKPWLQILAARFMSPEPSHLHPPAPPPAPKVIEPRE
jgi:drug/metabolite transporter (DMT)-like permease